MQLRNWSAAREAWKALCGEKGDVRTWIQYARAAERSERFQEAGRAWEMVQQFDAANQEAATALGRLPGEMVKAGRTAFVEGRWIEAYEFLSAVPRDVPARAEADRRLEHLGRHLRKRIREAYKQRNYAEIAKQASIALALLANDADVLSIVGRAARHVQQSLLAAQAWSALIALRPDYVHAQLALAESCIGIGALDEAERLLSGVFRQDPSNERAGVLQVRLRGARSAAEELRHVGGIAEGGQAQGSNSDEPHHRS
jgi:tetratricopeptide (TPR) repeat protein